MNAGPMRVRLAEVYPSERWKKKLKAMPDNQVVAIFRRLQNEGRIR